MSPPDGAPFGKRALVELSHAIERFAPAARPGAPLVVIAMFQRLSYLSRETDVYREIAARADVTLVGLVEDLPPQLPHAVLATPEPPEQDRWNVPLRFLADRLDSGIRERAGLRLDASVVDPDERDPRTGLLTGAFLERWTAGLGGGLPVGLVLLRMPGVADLRAQYGLRAELAALQGVTRSAGGLLGPVDRLVRLGPEDFVMVLPSWAEPRVLELCDEVCARGVAARPAVPVRRAARGGRGDGHPGTTAADRPPGAAGGGEPAPGAPAGG